MIYKSTQHQIDPLFDVKKTSKLCVCKIVAPILNLSRFSGFLPLKWHHTDRCNFERSSLWLTHSAILICAYSVQIFNSIDFMHLTKEKSLPILLNNITDAIYGVYIILLAVLNVYRYPRWVRAMNRFMSVLREGIFCQSAMGVVLKVEYSIMAMFVLGLVLQAGLLVFLYTSEHFHTDFTYSTIISKVLQSVSFAFYAMFLVVVSVFVGVLACFEKLTISCLKYTPVHPMKGINETNNTRDFMGFFTYELCKEHHPITQKLAKLPQAEVVEFLRILHEEISLIIYELNNCMNPQFLCHTVVELTVLIIEWYAVIVYMAFDFKAPMAPTIHVLNCYFVLTHTLGMFLFLKNAQQLKNMIQGLNNFLLEYSTRITSLEEHQQVRLFIEKLKQHRPLTASGVFTIDLGIAGPISANILTYVLVALQFEIPKEE